MKKKNSKTMKNNKTQIMKTTIKTLSLAAMALFLFSCDDDDEPESVNEEEVITTVRWTLTNDADPMDEVEFSSVDADGEGPEAPEVRGGTLAANATYSGDIIFRNDIEDENITIEVREEGDEHEVFYVTAITGVSIAKNDNDADGNPLGLETTVTTGDAGTGTINVTLRHEPTKPNDGTLSSAGGETDIQVAFPVTIN